MFDTIPAGKYFFGDPSLVCSNQIFHYYWGEVNRYEPGLYIILDKPFFIFPAICGDGYYKDNEKNTYLVDSGMIGLVSIDLCSNISDTLINYQLFNFKNGVVFHHLNGIFEIISSDFHIQLNTQKKHSLPITGLDPVICSDTELDEEDLNEDNNSNASIEDFNEDMIDAQYKKKVNFMEYVNESEEEVYQKSLALEKEKSSNESIKKKQITFQESDSEEEEQTEPVSIMKTKQFFKQRR